MSTPKDFVATLDSDARKTPRRIAFITKRTSPQVHVKDEERVMTYPEVFFRLAVAIEALTVALVVVSLIWNAPLESLADPTHTPNPAKAPWYFLGLQELLHYFPPVVAGVLIPGMVVAALIVIPYFNINIEGRSVWVKPAHRRWAWVGVPAFTVAIFLLFAVPQLQHESGAVPFIDRFLDLTVPILPTLLVGGALLWSSFFKPGSSKPLQRWLADRPISFWIMTWFLMELVVLTAVGTFFRGPGWSWVAP